MQVGEKHLGTADREQRAHLAQTVFSRVPPGDSRLVVSVSWRSPRDVERCSQASRPGAVSRLLFSNGTLHLQGEQETISDGLFDANTTPPSPIHPVCFLSAIRDDTLHAANAYVRCQASRGPRAPRQRADVCIRSMRQLPSCCGAKTTNSTCTNQSAGRHPNLRSPSGQLRALVSGGSS
jgi:hypothetical protein